MQRYGSDGTDTFACGGNTLQTSTLVRSQVGIVSRILPYEGGYRKEEKENIIVRELYDRARQSKHRMLRTTAARRI